MKKIPLFKIYHDADDIKYIVDVIERGSYWATGPEIQEFELKISEYIGTKYAVVFNNGTSALHATLFAHGIGQGSEVIVPSFTFISTANAPLFVGAKPVLAEIEDRTYGLDPEDVKERITKKTKAIMPIHYAGSPCMIRELKEIADDYNLLLIEDAAESFGAKIKDQKVGTFGGSAILSFCQNKIISTGEGGAVTTDSRDIYEKLKLIRSHGRVETQDYFSSTDYMEYVSLGYNFRMPSMCASLGISQMNKLEDIIRMRQSNSEYLTKSLSAIEDIVLPRTLPDYSHVYQMYTIRVKEELRASLIEHLSKKGIQTKINFSPVHLTQFYREKFGYKSGELPLTECVSNQVLSLPMYPTLTEKEMNYIIENLYIFFEGEL